MGSEPSTATPTGGVGGNRRSARIATEHTTTFRCRCQRRQMPQSARPLDRLHNVVMPLHRTMSPSMEQRQTTAAVRVGDLSEPPGSTTARSGAGFVGAKEVAHDAGRPRRLVPRQHPLMTSELKCREGTHRHHNQLPQHRHVTDATGVVGRPTNCSADERREPLREPRSCDSDEQQEEHSYASQRPCRARRRKRRQQVAISRSVHDLPTRKRTDHPSNEHAAWFAGRAGVPFAAGQTALTGPTDAGSIRPATAPAPGMLVPVADARYRPGSSPRVDVRSVLRRGAERPSAWEGTACNRNE